MAEQAQLRRRLQADRASAAVLWKRALDPRLASTNPEQLAQAWSSAVAWETLDARAAATARRLDERLRATGAHPETVRVARESDDYAALALLLARGEEPNPAAGQPVGERRIATENIADRDGGQYLDTAAIIEQALDPATAAEVLGAEALPVLETELARAAGRGHDPVGLLSRVAAQRSLSDAVDPAAVLHYRLQRHLNLEPDPADLAAGGEDPWWLLDEATRDQTGSAHDRADGEAERWAERAAGGLAADPHQDPVTGALAQSAAEEHGAEATGLERSASALSAQARQATIAAAAAESEPGFSGGSAAARLAAESYPHSLRTGLARASTSRHPPTARTRRAAQQAEHDHGR